MGQPTPGLSPHSPAQLREGLAVLGLTLDEVQQQGLLAYLALLAKWNRTYSLTALRDPEKAVSHHLLDSLAILPAIRERLPLLTSTAGLLDVGSGGGQPGLPLALAEPVLCATLADSNQKKVAFLQQAIIELGLKGRVAAHCGRIESWQPACKYGVITSRAFAELADFVGLTRHLLAPGGCWLAMKGIWPQEEIDRLPPGITVAAVLPLHVPGVDGERHLVVLHDSADGSERTNG